MLSVEPTGETGRHSPIGKGLQKIPPFGKELQRMTVPTLDEEIKAHYNALEKHRARVASLESALAQSIEAFLGKRLKLIPGKTVLQSPDGRHFILESFSAPFRTSQTDVRMKDVPCYRMSVEGVIDLDVSCMKFLNVGNGEYNWGFSEMLMLILSYDGNSFLDAPVKLTSGPIKLEEQESDG